MLAAPGSMPVQLVALIAWMPRIWAVLDVPDGHVRRSIFKGFSREGFPLWFFRTFQVY